VQGTVLDTATIDGLIEQFAAIDADARRAIVGLQPDRAPVILGGACLIRAILTALDQPSVIVSVHGLRHGLFAERFA